MGRRKWGREAFLAPSFFPSSPACLLFFIIAIFGGIPSGSLCGGEAESSYHSPLISFIEKLIHALIPSQRYVLLRHAIMKGLALSLELSEDFFHDIFNPAFPLLALWHYPPVPAVLDSWGVGPHTDYGVLTLLMQDDVGGLQIETESGKWIDVPPIPGN